MFHFNEMKILLMQINFTDKEVFIPAGERIGQGVFLKY